MSIGDEEPQLDHVISTMYGGPLEDFVRRRDAVVKELRSAGRREDASLIKSLRKPSRMAWALDMAALHSPEALDALEVAVGATIEAHATGRDVRGAIARLRVAVREFAAHAARAAVDAGQRVEEAALANAVLAVLGNADAFLALRRGRLADVPDAGGLDFLSSLPTPPAAAVRAKPETPRAPVAPAASAATSPSPTASPAPPSPAPPTSALPSPPPTSPPPPSPPSAPSPEAIARERAARDALRESRNAVAHARQRMANAQRTLSETEAALRAREDQLRQLEGEVRAIRDQRDNHHEESEDAAAKLLEAERTLADAEAQLERLTGEA